MLATLLFIVVPLGFGNIKQLPATFTNLVHALIFTMGSTGGI